MDLLSLTQDEMEQLMKEQGFPAFRGRQLFDWCQKKEVDDFSKMSNLPKSMVSWLEENCSIGKGKKVNYVEGDDDNTIKFLLEFPQETLVETVLMCYKRDDSRNRNTLCVSTQGGCAMNCRFCASTIGGFQRNLTAGEMIEQVHFANAYLKKRGENSVSNVVFMGMGEPFLNFEQVMKSVKILNKGKNIGMRRMTISTAGIIPQIYQLAEIDCQITLAVSLHAPNNEIRNQLMPINKKYPIEDLMQAIDAYTRKTHRRVTIEYALFEDLNDSESTAKELGILLKGRLVNVNLLRGNPVPETGLKPGDMSRVEYFIETLKKYGVEGTLRESRGLDIDGACGQLRRKQKNNDNR